MSIVLGLCALQAHRSFQELSNFTNRPIALLSSNNGIIEAPKQPLPIITQATSHIIWLKAASIDKSNWADADQLITWESTWNPNAINPQSGACGLMQELPCGKSGCKLGDAICELKWGNNYILSRYGSYDAAIAFHLAHNWY